MKDDISDIVEMYDRDPDSEHERLERHQLEFDLTMKALAQYLPGKGSILEIGAASGRYTVALVRLGYQVTAVDLSEALAEKWWEN
ncbi:MAG: class I SAM-dependent methyltransferase, partial [Anaerolineales bacterium]